MATTAAILEIAVRADTTRASTGLTRLNTSLNKTASAGTAATRQTSLLNTGLTRTESVSKRTTRSNDLLNRSTSRVSSTLKNAAKGAAAAAVAYVSIAEAKQAVSATLDLFKATKTLNAGFGLSIKMGSELGAVLMARGADATSTGMAFNTLSRQVVAAGKGTETAVDAFKALGVSQKELKTTSPDQQLLAISDGMEKLGKGALRASVTSTLFGRGWKTVGPVLRDGADAMQDQLDLANKYGASFGGKTIKSIEDLRAAQIELKLAQLGLQVQFTEKIAPALVLVGLGFARFINQMRKGKGAAGDIADALRTVGRVIQFLWPLMKLQAQLVWKFLVKPLVDGTKAIITGVNGIISGFQKAKDVVGNTFGAIKSVVVDAGKAIVSVLAKIVRVVGAVINAFNSLKSAPGDLLGGAKDKLGDLAGNIPGLQRGGTLVGGSGTGDKVAAMLEPGEVVLNRKAVAALGGSQRANSINAMVPRFAGGGVIGGAVGQAGKAGAGLAAAAGMALLKAVAKAVGSGGNVAALVKEASRMDALHQPYLWGGGHAGFSRNGPWDCSGAVSQLVHGAGLPLAGPMVSGGFQNWGQPGRGKMSVLANPEHVYAVINGRAWGTSASNPGGGAGWIDDYTYRSGFTNRHAALANSMRGPNNKKGQPLKKGFQAGGVVGDFARAIVDTKAPHSSALALMMAGYAESGMRDLGYGDSTSQGALQLLSSTASSMGLDPHDEYGVAKAFLTRGYWGKGSGIGLANNSPATIAHLVQGNATGTGVYSAQRGRAVAALRSAGLKWDKHGVPRIGAAAAKTPKVKSPNKKKKPGGGGDGGSDWLELLTQAGEDRFSLASELADAANIPIASANELIGQGNFEALQRFQVGSSQNPILGLAKPGMPVPASLIPEMEPWQFLNQASGPTGSASPSISSVGVNNVTPQGDLMGGTLPKRRKRPVAQHTHVYIAGKEVRHATKTELRRAARGGHRPLPSRGGGL